MTEQLSLLPGASPPDHGRSFQYDLYFTVYGNAAPAGSKRGFPIHRKDGSTGVVMAPASKRTKPWMDNVTRDAQRAMEAAGLELFRGPLWVSMTFYTPRPKYHYLSDGVSLGKRATAYPAKPPDRLKLARAVEDALTGIVWADDALAVLGPTSKLWGEPARVEVGIVRLP